MTKVLHVIDSGGLYGAEQVLMNCVEEQIELGCQPVICSIGDPRVDTKPLEVEARRRGLPIVAFRMRPGLNLLGALRIAAFARREGFEVIHSHGYQGNVLFGLMPRWLRRLLLVATVHGWTHRRPFGRMALYQWLDRQALRFVDQTVVVTESMLALKAIRRLKRVTVIRNGIDTSGRAIERRDGDATTCVIGAAGRLSPEKGFDRLIEALALVRQTGLDARLIVIGEGAERPRLEQLISAKGLAGVVQLPGYRTDIDRFLAEVDLFVVSSLTEGAPMSVLEAMRARTPIVATAVGGIPDMLDYGQAGILVEPGDAAALARAIRFSIRERGQTRDRVSRAHNRVKECYDRGNMAQAYCALYRKCLASNLRLTRRAQEGQGTSHDVV